jgi:diguanylate cyclase
MSVVLIELGFALIVATSGVVAGWWLRSRTPDNSPSADNDQQQRRARETLIRLQELAAGIATHVGAHSSRVEQINQELIAGEGGAAENVIATVAKLISANKQMQEQLDSAEVKLQEQTRLVETTAAEARTDALTGLANRRAFDDELLRCAAEFNRLGKTYTVVLGDIDHFKRFNDTHGHQVGDEVLRSVAIALRGAARETDMVARYGGEEFVVIMQETRLAEAQATLRRLREAVESARFLCGGNELQVTCSFGAAQLLSGENAPEAVRRADAALYAAKAAGRNCCHWHDGTTILAVANAEKPAVVEATAAASKPAEEAKPSGARKGPCDRSEFSIALGRRLAEWRRGGAPPAVVLVRIDEYPGVLLRHGQQAAQMVLRATAQFLGAAVRDMDMVAQYDETTFAMLLPGAGMASVIRVAERVRQAIARCELPIPTGRLSFTVSVAGVVTITRDETQMLLWRVEEALDSATKAGGNCCYFHNGQSPESSAVALQRMGTEVS